MTAIVDYGVGNLFSLCSSLAKIGEEAVVTADASVLKTARRIILPGVGAFGDAAKKLESTGLIPVLKQLAAEGKPILGICLGMQLLFDSGLEYGLHKGLGLIPGQVRPLAPVTDGRKIPHMGWNPLHFIRPEHPLFRYIREGDPVYFVHSYYAADCEKNTLATAEYGVAVTAAVANGSVMGCQFHPEKSGTVGLNILRAFCEMEEPLC